jgi:hypothetical protein
MSPTKAIRGTAFGAVLLSAALLAGCGGGGMSGTYSDSNGVLSFTFHSGKVDVNTPGGTVEAPYSVDGDRIVIKSPQGNIVIHRNKDGTLDGPLGPMSKTGS